MIETKSVTPGWHVKTSDAGTGCYVHLPFCDRICPYCDFAVVAYNERLVARYMPALLTEIGSSSSRSYSSRSCSGRALGRFTQIQTLYFGGGTPSALSSDWLERLSRSIFDRFATKPGSIEFTIEANPSRNVADLPKWFLMGVNRLSVGVQSFDDEELHHLGRTHDGRQAGEFFRAARGAGFANVSLDLMAGVPGQTSSTFEASLNRALELGPDHISVYGLTIEAGTPYAKWHSRSPDDFPNDDALATLLELAHDRLTAAGMVHYEISNFARPGFECAHNLGYWRQRNCLAFGASAAGYHDGLRYANIRDMHAYCEAIEAQRSPIAFEEKLSKSARIGEAAMLALRMQAGIEDADFGSRFGIDPRAVFAGVRRKCKAAGLLEEDPRGMRLTRSGRLLANTVCAEFLEPACEAFN